MIRLRFGINELKVNKRYGSDNVTNKNCSFCPGLVEDESHFLFHCPVYSAIRQKYIAEFTEMPRTLNQLLETPSTFVSRKVAMYIFLCFEVQRKTARVNVWFSEYTCFLSSTMMLCDCKHRNAIVHPPPPPAPLLCMGRWPSQ